MGLGRAQLKYTAFLPEQLPEGKRARWAVLGRSNVGKSSFLNALIHPLTLFKTSSTPGKTRGLIGVEVEVGKAPQARLEIVDLPGFGFAKGAVGQERETWQTLAAVLRERSQDSGLLWVWLVDPLRKPDSEEAALLRWLAGEPYSFVFTKADQVKPVARKACEEAWADLIEPATEGPYWTSSLKGEGFDAVIKSARSFVREMAER
jgi:GTP-binding protein